MVRDSANELKGRPGRRKTIMCISSSWLLPKRWFLAQDLHLQRVLGNPRTGGVRSCCWYCRKELVLGVERVNKPGNHVWLKTLGNAPYRKGVFGCSLGFVVGCSRGIKGFCWG